MKRVLKIIAFLILATALLAFGVFLYIYIKSKVNIIKDVEHTKKAEIEVASIQGASAKNEAPTINSTNAEFESVKKESLEQKVKIEELEKKLTKYEIILKDEKEELEKLLYEVQNIKKINIKNIDYSAILLTLISIENKLHIGGSILQENTKLKILTAKIPKLYSLSLKLEDIGDVVSKQQIKSMLFEYIKNVKSIMLEEQKGKTNKLLSIVARYFSVLNKNNKDDEKLLLLQELIYRENFTEANKIIVGLKANNNTIPFTQNLEKLAIIEQTLNELYFYISVAIEEK